MSTSVVVGPHRQQQPQQSRRVSVAMFFTIFAVSLLMEIHISGLLPTAGQLGFENDAVTTSTTTSVRTTTQSTTTTLLLSFSSSLTTHHNSASSSATTIHHCAEEEMRSFACHHHPASTWSKAVHVLQSPWLFIHNNDDSCHSSTCVLVRLVRYVAFQNAAVALVQHLKVQGVPVEIEYEDDASLVFSDKQEALSFAELVQSVASEECWSLIQRYFQVQQNDKNEPQEMAWLLSFPGSVSVTLRMI